MNETTLDLKMPEDQYFRDPAPAPSLNASIAKVLLTSSPLHAWTQHPRLNPNFVEKDTETFDIGRAAHALLLQGIDKMMEMPFPDWRTKDSRVQRDLVRQNGQIPILSKYVGDIYRMIEIAKKALKESELGLSIEATRTEATVIWHRDGIWKRARIDSHLPPVAGAMLLDYKSAEDADPWAFTRQIINMGYDVQAAHYSEGYRAAYPECDRDPLFAFLVQEKTEPFACSIIGVTPELLDLGIRKMEIASATWRKCLESGKWPAYPREVFWADAPAWAISQFEQRNPGAMT